MSQLTETVLRVAVADDSREAVTRFTRELMPLITAGPPGTTGYAEGRPSVHPVFKGIVQTLAGLYDMQHDPELRDVLTYEAQGARHGMSFLPARTKEDLARRSAAYKIWADATLGFMGRCPDYLNAVLTAYATSADFFGEYASAAQ